MLFNTILLLLISLTISLPMAIATAIYLSEFAPPSELLTRLIQNAVNTLAVTPSIVEGI